MFIRSAKQPPDPDGRPPLSLDIKQIAMTKFWRNVKAFKRGKHIAIPIDRICVLHHMNAR